MSDSYFQYDVWKPKARGGAAAAASARRAAGGGGGGGGGPSLALPFRIQHVLMTNKGTVESVFALAMPKDSDQAPGAQEEDLRFAPPNVDLSEDVLGELPGEAEVGACRAEPAAEVASLLEELLAALEARDGPLFEDARSRLNQLATTVPVSEVLALEEQVSGTLSEAWWEFVQEDPAGAERFQREHIGPAFVVEISTPEPAQRARQLESTMTHSIMRYGGLHLGPRFRTRRSTYSGKGFRPGTGTFF